MTESEGGLEKVAEVLNWQDSKLFSPAERVALEYAERITYTDRQVDDALFAELKKHFTEAQIVELTAAIALENFRSKFNPTAGCRGPGLLRRADGYRSKMRQVVVPCARRRPVLSVRRPSAVPMRRPTVSTIPSALIWPVSGSDRPHEGDLEFQRRRSEALFDRRPYREAHAGIEQRRRQAAMDGACRVEMLAVGKAVTTTLPGEASTMS